MPVELWGDADGSLYRSSYFELYPGVWRQGDWIRFSDQGSCVVTGRSDATLNRGGVRLGTGEFYGVVEELPEIVDSLVVHLEDDEAARAGSSSSSSSRTSSRSTTAWSRVSRPLCARSCRRATSLT